MLHHRFLCIHGHWDHGTLSRLPRGKGASLLQGHMQTNKQPLTLTPINRVKQPVCPMWTSLVSGNAAGVAGENTAWESDLWPSCREPTASPRRPIKATQHIYNLYASVEYVLSYVALVPNFLSAPFHFNAVRSQPPASQVAWIMSPNCFESEVIIWWLYISGGTLQRN